jgi:hypothetical protein
MADKAHDARHHLSDKLKSLFGEHFSISNVVLHTVKICLRKGIDAKYINTLIKRDKL